MLAYWYEFLGAADDADATIAMRAGRTAIALNPAKRVNVVLGEQALRTRRGTGAEQAEQLTHLLSLMRLPHVAVSIIPADAQRRAIATIGFWIFDNNAVALETPTAAIKITRPQEVSQYATMLDNLHREAVHGQQARRLVATVLDSLQLGCRIAVRRS
jgi:hypothetical protein